MSYKKGEKEFAGPSSYLTSQFLCIKIHMLQPKMSKGSKIKASKSMTARGTQVI